MPAVPPYSSITTARWSRRAQLPDRRPRAQRLGHGQAARGDRGQRRRGAPPFAATSSTSFTCDHADHVVEVAADHREAGVARLDAPRRRGRRARRPRRAPTPSPAGTSASAAVFSPKRMERASSIAGSARRACRPPRTPDQERPCPRSCAPSPAPPAAPRRAGAPAGWRCRSTADEPATARLNTRSGPARRRAAFSGCGQHQVLGDQLADDHAQHRGQGQGDGRPTRPEPWRRQRPRLTAGSITRASVGLGHEAERQRHHREPELGARQVERQPRERPARPRRHAGPRPPATPAACDRWPPPRTRQRRRTRSLRWGGGQTARRPRVQC